VGAEELTGAERQKLHLQCKGCLRAVCEYRFYGSLFSGSAAGARQSARGLSRSTVSEWRMNCDEGLGEFAVALPIASRPMGLLPNAATAHS
jgi:hypothetical protein